MVLSGSNSVETSYSMADELKHVLSFYAEEKQKQKLDILQTPDIYIDMRSTAREVQQWLKAKQFSARYSRSGIFWKLFNKVSFLLPGCSNIWRG